MAVLGPLLATLPVVGALLVVMAANSSRVTRVRQFPMPAVAILYAILAIVALSALNHWVDDVLTAVFSAVPLLSEWYDSAWAYVIENTIVLLLFALLKLILQRGVFDRVFHGGTFTGSSIVTGIYRFAPDSGMWFVLPRNAMLRTYLRVFYWVSIGLVVVLMAFAGVVPEWPGFAAISFPAVAALVIGEALFAIDGVTEREFHHDISGEDDDARRVTNYAALRDVLDETFPDRVLDAGVRFSSPDAIQTFDQLDALAHSQYDADRIAAGHFARLKQGGYPLDANLLDAAAGLMRGRSALIGNPFYADLAPYLTFPAYWHLLQYHRCLLVCGRDAIADDLVRWFADGLESISGVPQLWNVGPLTRHEQPDLDVGVLRFADIHDLDLVRANDTFLRDVEYVILAEPSRLLATAQLGLSIVLSRCGTESSPVFAAFDRNHDGLVDALSHQLKTELTHVVAAAVPHGVSTEMVWRSDGPHLHAGILPSISRYLGVGTEIGAVALKYDVSRVDWVGAEAFPVDDMMWISGQYYGQIAAFADLPVSQHALAEAIHPHSNPWAIEVADTRFLIVEDEIRNLYETIRLYATRAQEQGFVNVISEDYLLRDYMIANREIFSADPKAIPSIVPDFARTERNLVLRLVLSLRAFGMTEASLVREFELGGYVLPDVTPPHRDDPDEHDREVPSVALLRELIAAHTGIAAPQLEKTVRPERVGEDGSQRSTRHFGLRAGSGIDELEESLRAAYFFVEDEVADRDHIGAVLYGLVHQRMLPGQFITHDGKYYQVQSIGDDARGAVVLRRAAEHIRGRAVYRQVRMFGLSRLRTAERPGARVVVDGIGLTRLFADITVESLGYLELPSRSDLAAGLETRVEGVPPRRYSGKEVLQIRLPEVPASVRRTMAVLLNELFVTVFPDAHHYVVALTADDDGSFGDLLDSLSVEHDDSDDAIYIVEDSLLDLGLLVAVRRHWRRLFEIIADYLLWQSTPIAETAPTERRMPMFEDDTPQERAERARIIAQQDAEEGSAARPPRRPPWWRRLDARMRRWFTRSIPAAVIPVAASDPVASGADEEAPAVDIEPPVAIVADLHRVDPAVEYVPEAGPEAEPEPEPVPEPGSEPAASEEEDQHERQ